MGLEPTYDVVYKTTATTSLATTQYKEKNDWDLTNISAQRMVLYSIFWITFFIYGSSGRTWTDTSLQKTDFKSVGSTSSPTLPRKIKVPELNWNLRFY